MSQTDEALSPDPSLSCSLYASGAIDQAIAGWILPFRRSWETIGVDASTRLWLWRHARHGEHLKLRVHAMASDLPALRQAAEQTALAFLARLPPAEEGFKRRSMPWPVIDADEDEGSLPEDRSFRFTRYQRQPPILGSPSLCDDMVYVSRFCGCLGSAHDWLLDDLEQHGNWQTDLSFRLLTSLIATAIDLAFSDAEAREFLAFYRDWLIRLPLLRRGADQATADVWTAKIHQQALGLAAPDLTDRLASPWSGLPAAAGAWKSDLQRFCLYAKSTRVQQGEQLKDFEATLLDLPLCKVLLALANALGYGMVDQAAVVHLLLFLLDGERAAESIRLNPDKA